MPQVGYSLISSDGEEIQFWGDIIGQIRGVPDRIQLPNGNLVMSPSPGMDLGEYRLVPRFMEIGTGSNVCDGASIIVYQPEVT